MLTKHSLFPSIVHIFNIHAGGSFKVGDNIGQSLSKGDKGGLFDLSVLLGKELSVVVCGQMSLAVSNNIVHTVAMFFSLTVLHLNIDDIVHHLNTSQLFYVYN